MKCEFCREEIQDDAKICPHCRRDTARGKQEKSGTFWKWVGILVGVPLVGFILLAIIGSQTAPENPADRIKASCERQYPYDSDASQRCEIALSVKYLEDHEEDRLREAARDAGVRP